ncbi:MAG: hypothetical protein WD991_02260 [Candidatus Paceibacterota bacterium]
MEPTHNDSSGTNTMLIVIVLVLLVGFGVWWFATRGGVPDDASDINVDLSLPDGTSEESTLE